MTLSTWGSEWIVDVSQCDPAALRDKDLLNSLFCRIVKEADLHPVGPATWHAFDHPGGVTGFLLLSESHLACHTFPEFGTLCINLFCCRSRKDPPWAEWVSSLGENVQVKIRRVDRSIAPVESRAR